MTAEQVLRLLDSFWFETTILSIKPPLTLHQEVDPISQSKVEEVLPLDKKLLLAPTATLEIRSHSDQNLGTTSCFLCDSPIPQHKLRTIPSGREIREFLTSENHEKEDLNTRMKQIHGHGRRANNRKGKNTSRSLTELEFKELKGFMDLGFVFSEEDKNSGLVSLIPGLQRLGSRDDDDDDDAGEGDDDDEEQVNIDDETLISDHKPYLSEAWDVLDQRRTRNPLLDWRVPDSASEIDMKHSLRFWAHTVASIAR